MNEQHPSAQNQEQDQDKESERQAVAALTASATRVFEQYPSGVRVEELPDGSRRERIWSDDSSGVFGRLDRLTASDGTISYEQDDIYSGDEWTTRTWTGDGLEVKELDVDKVAQRHTETVADLGSIGTLQQRIDTTFPPKEEILPKEGRLRRAFGRVALLVGRRK